MLTKSPEIFDGLWIIRHKWEIADLDNAEGACRQWILRVEWLYSIIRLNWGNTNKQLLSIKSKKTTETYQFCMFLNLSEP